LSCQSLANRKINGANFKLEMTASTLRSRAFCRMGTLPVPIGNLIFRRNNTAVAGSLTFIDARHASAQNGQSVGGKIIHKILS
jgi:hypothetical protein